jgi:hypothetical protein
MCPKLYSLGGQASQVGKGPGAAFSHVMLTPVLNNGSIGAMSRKWNQRLINALSEVVTHLPSRFEPPR